MIMSEVEAEIGGKLEAISGLRVLPYNARTVTPPVVIFAVPEQYQYGQTYRRGSDRFVLPVTVLIGQASARSSRLLLDEYVSGAGPRSIKAALDDSDTNTYSACSTVTVTDVEIGNIMVGAVEYLGATFNTEIYGAGG